eukprot:478759_1
MAARSGNQSGNWMLLQRKIFSRWCASKLESEGEVVKDIVNDLTGYNLVKLMEILSDQECSYLRKIKKTARMRAQHLDGAVLALRFSSELGVEMQVPASAENIVDHDEKPILALIWALMRRFIRFSDDDSGPSPEESLLMWVNSQISGYDLKPLTKYGSQMHDGMVLAAIVHKHRPKLIDFAAMSPSNKEANLQQVFVAAEKYFHLEQFLTPQEFMSLDNKSMFIYVSEYFYGVARMRKFELAARRIASLIEYTRTNDQMKLDYNGKAQGLRDHLDKVMAVLNDRTIDNTMAGARRKLDEFDQYKEKDKSEIAGQYLDVESFYNHLAVRLSDHHRPAYEPPQLVSAKGLGEALKVLENTEQERSVALHKELNRQIKLVQENDKHTVILSKLNVWGEAKTAYLEARETIESVGAASYHLTMLNAYDSEANQVRDATKAAMKLVSDFLAKEMYENMDTVRQREATADQLFVPLKSLSEEKRRVLDDHLAREIFNEKLRLMDGQHVAKCENIDSFNSVQQAFLEKRVQVDSVDAARAAIVELETHTAAIEDYIAMVPSLKEFGQKICAQKYESAYSKSTFTNGDALAAREARVDSIFATLNGLSADKNAVVQDDMAREVFKSKTMLENTRHVEASAAIDSWCAEKTAYATKKEVVNSVSDAQAHLSQFDSIKTEISDFLSHSVSNFKALGAKITAAKYSGISEWTFPTPEEVSGRESQVDARFAEVEAACAEKLTILEDHLEREEFKVQVHMWNTRHEHSFGSLGEWCAGKEAYLAKAEDVNSVADANRHLSMLDAFLEDRTTYESLQVSQSLKGLGERIRQAKYAKLSEWVFENPGAVTERESTITARFAALIPAAEKKRDVLKAALDLENRKEENRAQYATQAGEFKRWVVTQCESAAETHFGFTLLEVEGFAAKMESEDAGLKQDSQTKQTALRTVFEAGAALGITENCYTSENADSLAAKNGEMETALGGRRGAYAEALKLQRANDQLCKEFATAIEQFSSSLTQHRTDAAQASGELDQQLANVRSLEGSGKEAAELPKFDALEAGLKARDITDNIHTFLSAKDARVLLSQFHTFLQRKAKLIDEQISLKNRRGLTQEQFDDIEKQFDMFDTSKDGKLESAEIRGCLFSLGEELSSKKIKVILEQFGDATKDHLTKEGFTLMMVEKLGDQATKEEALAGFVLINRGQKSATNERMDLLSDPDLAFINKTAPALDDGWNYTVWVDEVYSR